MVVSAGTIFLSLMYFSVSLPYCEFGFLFSSWRSSPAERCVLPYFRSLVYYKEDVIQEQPVRCIAPGHRACDLPRQGSPPESPCVHQRSLSLLLNEHLLRLKTKLKILNSVIWEKTYLLANILGVCGFFFKSTQNKEQTLKKQDGIRWVLMEEWEGWKVGEIKQRREVWVPQEDSRCKNQNKTKQTWEGKEGSETLGLWLHTTCHLPWYMATSCLPVCPLTALWASCLRALESLTLCSCIESARNSQVGEKSVPAFLRPVLPSVQSHSFSRNPFPPSGTYGANTRRWCSECCQWRGKERTSCIKGNSHISDCT